MVAPGTSLDTLDVGCVTTPLNALKVEFDKDVSQLKGRKQMDAHTRIVLPEGQRMRVSPRFWSSFSSLFALNRSVFDYFDHAEVFGRIAEKKDKPVRIAFEVNAEAKGSDGRVLSCTNPAKPMLGVNEVQRLVDRYDGNRVTYANGIVEAMFECPFPTQFDVGGDDFRTMFSLQMPVDGYGMPSAFLAMLRLVCSNGMVSMTRAFKTQFALGKDDLSVYPVLERAVTTFNNEEGYSAMKGRIESATQSWASLQEASQLMEHVHKACKDEGLNTDQRNHVLNRFDEMCGKPLAHYGLSSLNELSTRRKRACPVQTSVYDLLNFASEASTHHFQRQASRKRIHGWIGSTLAAEYDLEGTINTFPDYADYFLQRDGGDASGDTASGSGVGDDDVTLLN